MKKGKFLGWRGGVAGKAMPAMQVSHLDASFLFIPLLVFPISKTERQ